LGVSTGEVLQLWGGVECTVNRVRDEFFDQVKLSGHRHRLSDLDMFAELGIKVLRYPILWESVEPTEGRFNWKWADERLLRMRELGLKPLVGLVHHGSGPAFTNLLDRDFPERLADYARRVAERYPWIELYNPVNEPLTTARFSGMYGHWYPHGQSINEFAQCLLNECKGVVLSMRAIREINPSAQLIQTEDLGKVHSTPRLAYQAEFENERRWLAYDLLTGNPPRNGPVYEHLRSAGVIDQDLDWFSENAVAPDALGINYYVTSERFLDENLEKYPPCFHGGNHREEYADVEAVRVDRGMDGATVLLREVWDRYRIPLVVTEAHLSCTREEQMRWLNYIWQSCQELRAEQVDVRAVTIWSLLGAYDWNTLLTRMNGYYEPGVFDLRSGLPRRTAIADVAQALAKEGRCDSELVNTPGWWQRPERVEYPAKVSPKGWNKGPQIVITGATGTLGRAFARLCDLRAIPYTLLSRQDLDIADRTQIQNVLEQVRPWALVNTAGYVRVDDAESDAEKCFRENTTGPSILAEECSLRGVQLATFSSDLVFDGQQTRPYIESDPVRPLSVYGRSKVLAEQAVIAKHDGSLVIRTSAFFGPWDQHNFVTIALGCLARYEEFIACDDAKVSPTYVPDLVNAVLDLLIDREFGVWQLANQGEVTWASLARQAAAEAGLDGTRIETRRSDEMGWVAKRPQYSVLSSERGLILPDLDNALGRYLEESEHLPERARASKAYLL
jgi:dTDP-4-dehydrorhamnose reductase